MSKELIQVEKQFLENLLYVFESKPLGYHRQRYYINSLREQLNNGNTIKSEYKTKK